jgi:NTE family protein
MIRPNALYEKHLRVGAELALKVFRLSPATAAVTLATLLALLLNLGMLLRHSIGSVLSSSFTVGQLLLGALLLLLGFVPTLSRAFQVLNLLRRPSEFLVRLLVRALPPAIGSGFVWLHLALFDRLFLRCGRLSRLGPPPA